MKSLNNPVYCSCERDQCLVRLNGPCYIFCSNRSNVFGFTESHPCDLTQVNQILQRKTVDQKIYANSYNKQNYFMKLLNCVFEIPFPIYLCHVQKCSFFDISRLLYKYLSHKIHLKKIVLQMNKYFEAMQLFYLHKHLKMIIYHNFYFRRRIANRGSFI